MLPALAVMLCFRRNILSNSFLFFKKFQYRRLVLTIADGVHVIAPGQGQPAGVRQDRYKGLDRTGGVVIFAGDD